MVKNNLPEMKTIKVRLKTIFKFSVDYSSFLNAIYRANDIIFVCYIFMYSYILYCFQNKSVIPITDRDFIRMSFKSLSKKSAGPKPKNNNGKLLIELNKFFENEFVYVLADKPKGSIEIKDIELFKFDSVNLSYIINDFEDQIETMIKNNITLNFCKYVHQYVN